MLPFILVVLSSALAGAVNAVAGGGTFLSFPVMTSIAGIPGTIANATNSFALWPAAAVAAYQGRSDLKKIPRRALLGYLVPSLIGGIFGAWLLVITSDQLFFKLIPFLIGGATLIFAFGSRLTRWASQHPSQLSPGLLCGQLMISIYGGYFGAGIGVLMLAGLALSGLKDPHEMNALKAFLGTGINLAASVVFVIRQEIDWHYAPAMTLAAMVGGYFGMHFARQLPAARLRQIIIVIGILLTVYYAWKSLRST